MANKLKLLKLNQKTSNNCQTNVYWFGFNTTPNLCTLHKSALIKKKKLNRMCRHVPLYWINSEMELLNRALEQVIDQLVTQKITTLRLEIESQKKTILGMIVTTYNITIIMASTYYVTLKMIYHCELKNEKMKLERKWTTCSDKIGS